MKMQDLRLKRANITMLESDQNVAQLQETGYEEAWELLGQPAPEIRKFVKDLNLTADIETAKKIGAIIDGLPDQRIPVNRILTLKNLANNPGEDDILRSIRTISGRPDAAEQYVAIMGKRDSAENRDRGYPVSQLIADVKSGDYESPVLLELPSGLYVIGGRTRLYAGLALKIPMRVKVIDAESLQVPTTESDDQDLFEVKMSPGELEKWARSPESEGIRSGFEAEMYFRNAEREDDREQEPDYDTDERAHSIRQVIGFFQGGNNGISPRTAQRLETALQDEFWDWQSERINDAWESDAEQLIRDYMETNVWENENEVRIRAKAEEMFDQEDTDTIDAIMTAGDRAPRFTKLSDKEEYAKENKMYQRYQEAYDAAYSDFEKEVEKEINEQGGYWDEAQEYFSDMARESDDYDEDAFFNDRYPYMTDIESAHGLDWPYWTGGGINGGDRSIYDIANSLSRALNGAKVTASSNYHSTARRPGRWIIEPDGSLDEPDDDLDSGLEVISPPMPLFDTLESLRTVLDWAKNEGDAYTNSSTGLHMGVSIPHKGGAVDYVKLILFMGDQHVLDQFGRAANGFCRSALEKLQMVQRERRGTSKTSRRDTIGAEKTSAAMDLMRKNLIELAAGYVQNGVGESKYTSAHIKDGYIEFRSPGGDYLNMDDEYEKALPTTMLRFARAMQIAGRPDLERREYSKKLYKLLSGFRSAETARDTKRDTKYRTRIETEGANDALELFAKYSSGMINSEELKKQWAEQVLAKEQPAKPQTQDWEVVDAEGNVKGMVQATDREKAIRVMKDQYPNWLYLDVRPKPGGQENTREYEVVRRDTGEVVSTFRAYNDQEALENAQRRWSDKGFAFSVREKTDGEPEKKLSRRAEFAKKIVERPTVWHVENTKTGKVLLIAAENVFVARDQARRQDPEFEKIYRTDRDSFLAQPATSKEIKQWQEQQAERFATDFEKSQQQQQDQEQDSAQVQQRVQGTGQTGSGRYRVSWTERRNGQEVQDSLNIDAASMDAAIDHVQRALEAQGRQILDIRAAALQQSGWQDQLRQELNQYSNLPAADVAAGEPIPGSTMDRARQRAQQSSGEFTGRWQVRNASTGKVVYTFGGVGNSQSDANRTAHTWLLAQGDRFDNQGPFDVVPEMR